MNITGTLLTVNAVEQTETTEFQIEFLVKDNELFRARFSVYKKSEDELQANEYLGEVYSEGATISCNLPVAEDLSSIFHQVKSYLEKIETYITTEPN